MDIDELSCQVSDDKSTLERYSMDMSNYREMPRMIARPVSENDVHEIMEYSIRHRIPVTARAAGSNLSGNAIGSGIIALFNKMDRVLEIKGSRVRLQPGLVYDRLNEQMQPHGFFLPYHVSSSRFCSIGGNVATRASGLRSIKYGTVDTSVRNIRMIDTAHGIIDTRIGIPRELSDRVLELRDELLLNGEAMKVLRSKEVLKTSMGYNLWALYKYHKPEDMVAHLVVGSAGTLGLFTEIEMELRPIPRRRVMLVALFDSLSSTGKAIPELRKLEPSLLELMDGFGTDIVRRDTDLNVPDEARATLMIEFDENVEEGERKASILLSRHALAWHVLGDPTEQSRIWGLRWKMLLEIKRANETPDRKYLSFVDDLGVPPDNLPSFITEIERIFQEEEVPVVIYGHVGEGNLHVRPLIDRENWKEDMRRIGGRCFETAFRYNGTVAAEHGAGRNRSEFIKKEWGSEVYYFFFRVKNMFDPLDLLNPGTMFSQKDFTEGLEF